MKKLFENIKTFCNKQYLVVKLFMKKLFENIKAFCSKNRLAVGLIALLFVAVVITSITVPIAVGRGKALEEIEIAALPAKTEYIERQELDTSGIKVVAKYLNGKKEEINDFSVDKTVLKLGDNLVTVSHTQKGIVKTATFVVTATERSVSHILVTTQPTERSYIENTYFDPTGIIVTAVYDNGETVVITDYTYDKTERLAATDKSVIISYTEKGVTKTAAVSITVSTKRMTGIEVTALPLKIAYSERQLFDLTGLVVSAIYNNGEAILVTGYTIDKIGQLTTGDIIVTISYSEDNITKTATISITVLARQLDGIIVSSLPTKTTYVEHTYFDRTGLVITAHYDNGESETIADYLIDKSLLVIGDDTVTITYSEAEIEKTITFAIAVVARSLSAIEITAQPNNLVYSERTYFDPTGLEITAVYDNEETEVVTEYYYDKVGALQTSDSNVVVSYNERNITKTATVSITVNSRQVTSLEIALQPMKLSYLEGALFDPTGLVIKVYFDNGEEAFVSGWDYDKKGALSATDTLITVTYDGITATVDITVTPKILTAIMASSLPQKIVYVEGEYFDFLGLEIYASYANAESELIIGWDYNKKEPLTTTDNQVIISYTLHSVTKTITIGIAVMTALSQDPEQKLINDVLSLLPPINEFTADDLDAIDYVLSLLDNAQNLTSEQQALKDELETKKQEIADNLPPESENEYNVAYALFGELYFGDISYGGNTTTYKNSGGAVALNNATSAIAESQGYVFVGWQLDGVTVTTLSNITEDVTVYAVFKLTATTNIVFKDYDSSTELLTLTGIIRTSEYDVELNSIASVIYSVKGILPIAYYNADKVRVSAADLSVGASITVFVKTATSRELHLANADSITLSWVFTFTDDDGTQEASKTPSVGIVFAVPVGATVTMRALHANISDILVDGVSKGTNINNITVQAVFVLPNGEYAASVTFATALSDIITISFIGYNQSEFVYPSSWNGIIAAADLEMLAFIYDEASTNYLIVYTIVGTDYYFADLAGYGFSGDTTVWVNRIYNRFTLTVVYANGTERFNNLVGKQTLQNALSGYSEEATELLFKIIDNGLLYLDAALQNGVNSVDLLAGILRDNITVYSDWEKPLPQLPTEPTFDSVDYSDCDFVGTWNSLFNKSGDILSSELTLSADGTYLYKTLVNGTLSVNISGIYRIENGELAIKTLVYQYDYLLLSADDLDINVMFASDKLLSVTFIKLTGSTVTYLDHTMTCGNIKPANYYGSDFIGTHENNGITIELLANGTANIIYQDVSVVVSYRVTDDKQLYIFSNGVFGTGEIADFFGGNEL
jgi:uncharacterized repeat protein (TIGR02543 family)